MKKLFLSTSMLIISFLPFTAFGYGHCKISQSPPSFCRCFIRNCIQTFGIPGECNYSHLVKYFNKVTPTGACMAHRSKDVSITECINGINNFIKVCG